MRIRIQGFDDQNFTGEYQKLQFTYPYRPPERRSKLQKKPSALKREHLALQNMKFLIFSILVGYVCLSGSGSGFLIRIRTPNPDPDADPLT